MRSWGTFLVAVSALISLWGCGDDSSSGGGGPAFLYTDALFDKDGVRVSRVVDAANDVGIRRFVVTWDRILPRSYASEAPNPSNLLILKSGGRVIHNVGGWWRTNRSYDQPGDAQMLLNRHLALPIGKNEDLLLAWEWVAAGSAKTMYELADLLRANGYTGTFYGNLIQDALEADKAFGRDDVILAPSWIAIPTGNYKVRNWDGRQDINDTQSAAVAIKHATYEDWVWNPGLVNGKAEEILKAAAQ